MFVTFISRILGFAGTEPLQRHYRPLQSHYESLRSHYGPLPSRYESLVIMERDGSKEPVPYNGSRSGPSLPRRVVGLGMFSKPLPQGDSLWLAPSTDVMRQAPKEEKRAGGPLPGDTIAQSFLFYKRGKAGPNLDGWSCCGLRLPSAEGLAWPAPSFTGGFVLAYAAVPPTPPSDVFQNRGTSPCTPGGGCAPCTPLGVKAGGRDGGLFSASLDRLAGERRDSLGLGSKLPIATWRLKLCSAIRVAMMIGIATPPPRPRAAASARGRPGRG